MRSAAERLVTEFEGVVSAAAYRLCRLAPTHVGRDDLEQEGRMALFRGTDKFNAMLDPAHRLRHVSLRIRGAMLDFIRSQYPTRDRGEAAVSVVSYDSNEDDNPLIDNRVSESNPMEEAQIAEGLNAIAGKGHRWAELLSYFLHGLSQAEAAAAMGLSEKQVSRLKFEILRSLQKYCG